MTGHYAAFVLTGVVNTLIGPVLPWLVKQWSLSDAAAGALFTAQFAGGLTGGTISGLVTTRIGDARTMAAGFVLMAAGLLAIGVGPYSAGIVGMAVSGLGLGFVIPPMNLTVARMRPERAAAALAALNLSWGVGAASWPLAIAAFTPLVGVANTLVALAIVLGAMAIRVASMLTPSPAAPAVADGVRHDNGGARSLLFGIIIVLYSGTEAAIGGWTTEHARRTAIGAPALAWELAASAFWAGLTIGRALAAWRLAPARAETVATAGIALAGCAVGLLLVSSDAPTVAAAAALAGLGLAPVFPVTVAALARECPPRVAGPLIALAALGAATIPWLVGAASDRAGSLASGLATLMGVWLILMALHVIRVFGLRPLVVGLWSVIAGRSVVVGL